MDRKTAKDFDPDVLILFDAYVHGALDRRGFLEKASRYAAGGVTAAMLLDALNPRFAEAQQVAKDDKRIEPSSSPTRRLRATPPRRDTWCGRRRRRASCQASWSCTRTAASTRTSRTSPGAWRSTTSLPSRPTRWRRSAGYPGDEDAARQLFPKLDQAKTREDFVAAAAFLKGHAACTGKIGVVGFCWGGGIANMLATRLPDLGAAVPFYGNQPSAEEAAKIKAPLLIHYAATDDRINAGWPAYEAALKAAGVKYEAFTYPGTQHGFNNDTTPRYDEAAAKLAWQRTMEFFNKHLR